jgi:hypothetical protein
LIDESQKRSRLLYYFFNAAQVVGSLPSGVTDSIAANPIDMASLISSPDQEFLQWENYEALQAALVSIHRIPNTCPAYI